MVPHHPKELPWPPIASSPSPSEMADNSRKPEPIQDPIAFSSVHLSGSKGMTTRTGGSPDQRSFDLHGALQKRRPPFDQPPGQQRNPSSTQQQIPKSSIDGSGSSTHLELDSKRTSKNPATQKSGSGEAILESDNVKSVASGNTVVRLRVQQGSPPAAMRKQFRILIVHDDAIVRNTAALQLQMGLAAHLNQTRELKLIKSEKGTFDIVFQ
ncbi:hypothetical protein ACLOJK_004610 [Asimina triloba]